MLTRPDDASAPHPLTPNVSHPEIRAVFVGIGHGEALLSLPVVAWDAAGRPVVVDLNGKLALVDDLNKDSGLRGFEGIESQGRPSAGETPEGVTGPRTAGSIRDIEVPEDRRPRHTSLPELSEQDLAN